MAASSARAEVTAVRVEGTALGLVTRAVQDAANCDQSRLLASCRETGEQTAGPVRGPGGVSGSGCELWIDLGVLARDVRAGKQVWDLWLTIPAPGGREQRLRLGLFDDGPGLQGPAVEFAAPVVGDVPVRRRMRVYFTDRDNLSVQSSPVPPRKFRSAAGSPSSRAARLLLRALARIGTAAPSGALGQRANSPARPPVYFLLLHAYGMGGTIRTTMNTANYLAAHGWRVEILSVLRRRDHVSFPLDRRVKVRTLVDSRMSAAKPPPISRRNRLRVLLTGELADRLAARPSVLCPPEEHAFASLTMWTDLVLLRRLRSLPPCVLVSTRPVLNLLAARFAPDHVLTIGQEHLNFEHHPEPLRRHLASAYGRLDVLTVLTHEDEKDYTSLLGPEGPRVVRLPNALPQLGEHEPEFGAKVVVAVGRLTRQKGFDLLIRAFRSVADAHPDWELRIFGTGKERASLERLIATKALGTSVRLMGRTDDVGKELAGASIFALSSRFEGLPMVLLEAMSVGLPAVSFDCPRGPRDVISDGTNGFLVPEGDVRSFAARLCQLIEHPEGRASMGAAARHRSRSYALDRVGPRWEELIDGLWALPPERSPEGSAVPR